MRVSKKKILGAVLVIAVLLSSSFVLASSQPQGVQNTVVDPESIVKGPKLAEVIPLAAQLSGRLAVVENTVRDGLDISSFEEKYAEIEANLDSHAGKLKQLMDSKECRYIELVQLEQALEQENGLIEAMSKPLKKEIRKLEALRKEWLKEKIRWDQWQLSLTEDGTFDQLKSVFERTHDTINTSLTLVLLNLEAILAAQEKSGTIQARIYTMLADLDVLIMTRQRATLFTTFPPMFSSDYFSQLRSGMWHECYENFETVLLAGDGVDFRYHRAILIQILILLFLTVTISRNRRVLKESKRWHFLAIRPFSTGLFLVCVMTMLIYECMESPSVWKIAIIIVGGISFARSVGGLIKVAWKRQLLYGLAVLFIAVRVTDMIRFPSPLLRLLKVLVSLVGLVLCLLWAAKSVRHKDSPFYSWLLRLASLFFFIIVVTELWGKELLLLQPLELLIELAASVIVYIVFMYITHGCLEWLFQTTLFRRVAVNRDNNSNPVIAQVERFIDIVVCGTVLIPSIIVSWGVYDNLGEAAKSLLAFEINLGSLQIRTGQVVASVGTIYFVFILSKILQKLYLDVVLHKRKVGREARVSIARLIHYVIVLVGFLLAIRMLGFDLAKITIMLSALGVGIGFGLQGIVNNFVSGLILLFERPVRVGDTIEIGGHWAEIRKIGLRSTAIRTFNEADVIVPNSELVNNQVTNWTLTNRLARLTIPVGVAYGSDVPIVMETLMACAREIEKVASTPLPQVYFLGFGESSLEFQLRCWILEADYKYEVTSQIHQKIDLSFHKAKIEIAFPQRDLHLRSIDESITLWPPKT